MRRAEIGRPKPDVDTDTAIGGPHAQFPSTRHSLLDAVARGLTEEALGNVIALYWKPVYQFIRVKFRRSNEDAKDLTQSFFAGAIQRDFFRRFDPARASFRGYIRMAVERFIATEHQSAHRHKRGGLIDFEPVHDQIASADSPEHEFERAWQRQLFALAIDDLREHCDESGKRLRFEIFEAYDLAPDERPSYSALAAQFGVPETTVTNHLAWARRTLKQLVTDRLRGVTSGDRELRDELRRLWI